MATKKRFIAASEHTVSVKVDPETVAFIRTINAASLLLLQSDGDKTQQEAALMMIIEACDEELLRLGITDKSHTKLPDSRSDDESA